MTEHLLEHLEHKVLEVQAGRAQQRHSELEQIAPHLGLGLGIGVGVGVGVGLG
jgi:hypothetical protein